MDLSQKSWELEKFEEFTVLENGREVEEFLKRKKLLMKKTDFIYTNVMDSV